MTINHDGSCRRRYPSASFLPFRRERALAVLCSRGSGRDTVMGDVLARFVPSGVEGGEIRGPGRCCFMRCETQTQVVAVAPGQQRVKGALRRPAPVRDR